MYEQKRSNNRRSTRTSHTTRGNSSNRGYGKSTYKSKGYRGRRRSKNRRMFSQKIPHAMYISKAENLTAAPAYVSQKAFSDFGLAEVLARNISSVGYERPTKIQDEAISKILDGKDILGIASTGSGKTGAFLIPMIDKALKNHQSKTLIVTPTRELASQIVNEFRKLTKNTNLRAALVIGGKNAREQIRILRRNPAFIIATPGRLIDLENRGKLRLNTFDSVVLDEVDQMLDMGFITDIKSIISKLAYKRQSLFFSATVGHKGELLANTLLDNPIKVESHKQCALKTIEQDIVRVKSTEQKMETLTNLLQKDEFSKVLVFSRTKHGADRISKKLRAQNVRSDSLHGNKSQNLRSKVLTNFRQDKINVLVATDVAARGIDVPDISHVINYDEPSNYNDYIHRIGRTGRIGKSGNALTFVLG